MLDGGLNARRATIGRIKITEDLRPIPIKASARFRPLSTRASFASLAICIGRHEVRE